MPWIMRKFTCALCRINVYFEITIRSTFLYYTKTNSHETHYFANIQYQNRFKASSTLNWKPFCDHQWNLGRFSNLFKYGIRKWNKMLKSSLLSNRTKEPAAYGILLEFPSLISVTNATNFREIEWKQIFSSIKLCKSFSHYAWIFLV